MGTQNNIQKNINYFLEKINTEFIDEKGNAIAEITKKAIKLDGDRGIQKYLNINISLCDYLVYKNESQKYIFLEFSDLVLQYKNLIAKDYTYCKHLSKALNNQIEFLPEYCQECFKKNLVKKFAYNGKKLIRNVLREMRREFIDKIYGSLAVIDILKDKFKIKSKSLAKKEIRFIICPYEEDELRVFDNFTSELNSVFLNTNCEISFMPLEKLNELDI